MGHSNQHSALNNPQGFTLVEVMISITILMFISFATYKMVDTNIDTKDRVVKEDRQTVQSLTAIGRLDSDISQIYNPLFSSSKMALQRQMDLMSTLTVQQTPMALLMESPQLVH